MGGSVYRFSSGRPWVCGLVTAGFRLQEGNLFIHSANPVFAISPFPIVALPNSAAVFALQKFERHIRDERSLKEVFEPFEYICHSSHGFASLFMQPPPLRNSLPARKAP
ncbi:MAG: hypothetical protein WCA96_08530 [Methylocella sp.]